MQAIGRRLALAVVLGAAGAILACTEARPLESPPAPTVVTPAAGAQGGGSGVVVPRAPADSGTPSASAATAPAAASPELAATPSVVAVPRSPTPDAVTMPRAFAAAPPSTGPLPLPRPSAPAPTLRENFEHPRALASRASVLIDDASGAVIWDQDAHTPLAPASLTKIATAIVAIERGDLNAWVEVDVDSRVMRGSTIMGLVPGDNFTLRDLLYGLLLSSGNDAALAIGRHISGSDAAFVQEMNALTRRIGLKESNFANPHGLSAQGQAISAHDLALLSRYGMTLPAFREIVAAQAWTARGSRVIQMRSLITSVLVWIPGADGVKSGFTRSAGRTLVASATRDGHRLIAVVMNDPQRELDAANLLEWGFKNLTWPQ